MEPVQKNEMLPMGKCGGVVGKMVLVVYPWQWVCTF